VVELLLAEEVRSLTHRFCDGILDPITYLAPVLATGGGLAVNRLQVGDDVVLIAFAPGALFVEKGGDEVPLGGVCYGDPLALAGVKTSVLLLC
jgi:hypothetical protein